MKYSSATMSAAITIDQSRATIVEPPLASAKPAGRVHLTRIITCDAAHLRRAVRPTTEASGQGPW
jgi:hypothetical protein